MSKFAFSLKYVLTDILCKQSPSLLPDSAIDSIALILRSFFTEGALFPSRIKHLLRDTYGRLFLTLLLDSKMWNTFCRQTKPGGGSQSSVTLTLSVMCWLRGILVSSYRGVFCGCMDHGIYYTGLSYSAILYLWHLSRSTTKVSYL